MRRKGEGRMRRREEGRTRRRGEGWMRRERGRRSEERVGQDIEKNPRINI